jgi:hypothetical protein
MPLSCLQKMNGTPSVLGQGAMAFKGADAKMSVVIGAMAVSDLVKSTLGPKGMVHARPSRTPFLIAAHLRMSSISR